MSCIYLIISRYISYGLAMQFFHGLPPDRDPEGASEPIIGSNEKVNSSQDVKTRPRGDLEE